MMKILLLLVMYFFCHIKINRSINAYENIIEIPSAIYERLMYNFNVMFLLGLVGAPYSGTVLTTIENYGGKYYLTSSTSFSYPPYEYLVGYYFLKDI